MACAVASAWAVLVDVAEGMACAVASAWVVFVDAVEGVGDAVGTGEGVGGVGGGGRTVGLFSTFRTTFTVRGLFKSAAP